MIGTFWPSVTEPKGERFDKPRSYIIERFQKPIVTANKRDLHGFAFSTFKNDYRNLSNHEASHALGYDLDGPGTDLDVIARDTRDLSGFIHTSFRHRPDAHRGRAELWLDRPVTAAEHSRLWRFFLPRFPTAGTQSGDASRLWYMPGIPPGGEFRFIELRGALIEVDKVLAVAPVLTEPVENPAPIVALGRARTDAVKRAESYLHFCDPAVSGQGGHGRTFVVAMKLTRGFGLDENTAYALMCGWNLRCSPPWCERDLRRKIHQAAVHGTMPWGKLLDARRESRAP